MNSDSLIACHECDLLHNIRAVPGGGAAKCTRCGAVLYRDLHDSLDRTLLLTVAGLILFIIANIYPFMTFKLSGREQDNTLFAGVRELYDEGFWELAILVFACSILFPAIRLCGMLYVLYPLRRGRPPWKFAIVFRWLETMLPWAMMEVYMLGVLVAIVKLAEIATIVPGIALYAFSALIIVTAWSGATLDPRIIWDRATIAAGRSSA